MKITELRIGDTVRKKGDTVRKKGDTVRKKGDTALFRVRNLYEDGIIDVIEITDEYDKRAYFRSCSEFELVTGNAIY